MGTKKGIETYGEISVAATLKEYKKLNKLAVFGALNPYTLRKDDQLKALQTANIIK